MKEAQVRLVCPECRKDWSTTPRELPAHNAMFHCPNCHATRYLAEFTRTDRDLATLKQLG